MGVRLLLLVGLLDLAGCDRAFGLDKVGIPSTDASTDGVVANPSCATLTPPPFLCVDCDDGPVYYENGVRFLLGTASSPAAFSCRPPAFSGSNALWIESARGQYYNDVSSATPSGTKLVATFDLDLSKFVQASGVLLLELKSSPNNAVMVSLQVQASAPSVIIQGHCAPVDCDHYATVFDAVPAGWFHGTLSVDTSASTASIRIDPATTAIAISLTPNSFVGTPFVRFGAIDANAGAGTSELGLDNLVVMLP